jgi:RNA polymerase sigma-70 factor (ECF subfamily)
LERRKVLPAARKNRTSSVANRDDEASPSSQSGCTIRSDLETTTSVRDNDSRAWIHALSTDGPAREDAVARLHGLLLRAARFEVRRRARAVAHLRGGDLEDLALQSANDALVAVLAKLDGFRGQSRFTTWVYKFALLEAAVKVRRLAWQGREIPLEPEKWPRFEAAAPSPEATAQHNELLGVVSQAIDEELTPRQREVFVAVALNEVPIDVMAERLGTTRGALYKTLHDARRKLRLRVKSRGLSMGDE